MENLLFCKVDDDKNVVFIKEGSENGGTFNGLQPQLFLSLENAMLFLNVLTVFYREQLKRIYLVVMKYDSVRWIIKTNK